MVFRRPDSWQSARVAGLASFPATARPRDAAPVFRSTALVVAIGCALAGAGTAMLAPATAFAATSASDVERAYAIPAGRLSDVLAQFAATSGVLLSFDPQLLTGRNSEGLQGRYTVDQGFARLLASSGYELTGDDSSGYSLRATATNSAAQRLAPIRVVGAAVVASSSEPLPDYAGGQVARGGGLGILGNRDMMDSPFSITAYTSTLMKQQQAESVADVIDNDPSVQNTNPRTSRFDQFSVRGFPVLNSDIALNGLYSVLPTYALAVESLERVELLKGATAMLYGMSPSGGVGGSINVVPKRAGDVPTRNFTASYSSDSTFGGHLDLGQRFGEASQYGLRVNAAYRNGETAVAGQQQHRGLITVGLDYRGEHTRVSADIGHQDRKVDSPQERVGVAAGVGLPDAKRLDRGYAPDWSYTDTLDSYLAVRVEHDLNERAMLYGAFGVREGEYDFLRMNVSMRDEIGNFATRPTYFLRDETVRTAEVGVRAHLQTGPVAHALVFSATYFDKTFGNLMHNFASVASNLYDPVQTVAPSRAGLDTHIPKSGESTLNSFAFADTLSMWDERVQMTLGGRLQRVITDQYNQGALTTRYDEQGFTPAVAVLVKPLDHLSVYANYIEGLSEGPTAPDFAENANEVFEPVSSEQIELGAKLDYGRVGATLGIFQLRKPSGLTDPVTNVFAVDGMQRNRGVELNIFGEPVRRLRVLAGMMYLERRLVRTANVLTEGNTAPGTPRYAFNLGLDWDVAMVPGLTLTARALHNTSQYMDAANQREIPGWTRTDVGARYKAAAGDRPFTLALSVTNVLDEAYWSSASSNGLTTSAPRTVQLSASVDF